MTATREGGGAAKGARAARSEGCGLGWRGMPAQLLRSEIGWEHHWTWNGRGTARDCGLCGLAALSAAHALALALL